MDYDNDIRVFVDACNNACNAKFLIAEKHVSNILRSIAESTKIYNIFEQALKGYNFDAELHAAKTTVGGRSKLVLPQNQSKLIAFVFCLLMQIDTDKLSLREFLDEYFYHTNPNEEFTRFATTLIVPFRDVTEYIYFNGVGGYTEDEAVDVDVREDVREILSQICSVTHESEADSSVKNEIFALARAVEAALTPNRVDLITPLIIGLKNTLAAAPAYERTSHLIDKLYRVLSEGDII